MNKISITERSRIKHIIKLERTDNNKKKNVKLWKTHKSKNIEDKPLYYNPNSTKRKI